MSQTQLQHTIEPVSPAKLKRIAQMVIDQAVSDIVYAPATDTNHQQAIQWIGSEEGGLGTRVFWSGVLVKTDQDACNVFSSLIARLSTVEKRLASLLMSEAEIVRALGARHLTRERLRQSERMLARALRRIPTV